MVLPVSRYSNWRNILTAGLIAGLLAWLVVVIIGGQFAAATDGLRPFDLQPGLRAGDIPAQLPAYTNESRRIYARFFAVDFFLPLAAYGTVVLLWARLLARAAPHWYSRHPWVALFPLLPMLCDWGENLAFLILVMAWPRPLPWLAELAVWLHSGKFIGMIAGNLGLIVFGTGALWAWATDRFSRTQGPEIPIGHDRPPE
jgi:hypothetical protein